MRARNIKPGFFENEILPEIEPLGRLLFIGLWCLADRKGRLEDRPRRISGQLFPYDKECDVNRYLDELQEREFLVRYTNGTDKFIQIISFNKHQSPHIKERASTTPAPDISETSTGQAPGKPLPRQLLAPPDSLIPDSLIPDSKHLDDSDESTERKSSQKSTRQPVKSEYTPEFEKVWAIYPKREGSNPKGSAFKAWNARIRGGYTHEEINNGVVRYASLKKSAGELGTRFIMQAATFFGPEDPPHFTLPWSESENTDMEPVEDWRDRVDV
ncbi:MAG: hypothetical protein HQL68_09745 [Magnetococcales bacterium]|nr:hypothetical protein [Magnetococcales bacterium]